MQKLSPELANGVLDAAPDAMVIIDPAGTILFANRQASSIFGYSHEALVGQRIEMLMPERFRARHPALREAYGRDVRFRPMGAGLTLFGLRRDGSEFPVEISLSPTQQNGRLLVTAAIRDVTDHVNIEAALNAQLEDMRRLHELSTRLIGTTDLASLLEEILDATIALQRADSGGLQLRDPQTAGWHSVAQRGFSQGFMAACAGAGDGWPCAEARRLGQRILIEDVRQDPGFRPHLPIAEQEGFRAVFCIPITGHEGDVTGMLSTYFRAPRQLTDRDRQLTDIYIRLAAEQIARVRDAEALRSARDVANRASQSKSRFLATASHDLRQPLQTLALLNGTLRRTASEPLAQEALGQQDKAIGAMSHLLNALLDISKLESGAVRPEPTDFPVADLFEELRQEFACHASGKGLHFDVAPSAESIHSDPSLVGQVLRNLISNAIKYTRQGWVALRCLRPDPAWIRIEVLDSGIGIPAPQLQYIYDEFYQVGVPANTTRDGYGLGLSIVQRLVKLLEARLDVQSEVGRGSLFALTLPASHGAARSLAAARPDCPPRAARAPTAVLLVEDDPAVRGATCMLLQSDGYQVHACAGLAEALRQMRATPDIGLVITDYHLADGETGTQVIAALRSLRGGALRAILVTGDTSSVIKELARDPDLRIVSKPANADDLLGLVRELAGA